MAATSLLTLLLALLVFQASASGSGSLEASVGSEPNATVVDANANANAATTAPPVPASTESLQVTLAPIDTASSTSSTFQLVDNVDCNETVSNKIYVIYNKNRALFDLCVSDAQYQIFPFLGTKPSAAQVQSMATSTSCDVVFTGVLLADFPQCQISGFPLKAAVETLLKVHVDLVYGYAASPSAERFQEMMSWRRYVNLAKEAGVPCDSGSELYAEYEENLEIARSNSSIRVLPSLQIEYKLASGSWYGGEDYDIVDSSGSDSDDSVMGTVAAGAGSVGVEASDSSATVGNAASSIVKSGVVATLMSSVLGVLLVAGAL